MVDASELQVRNEPQNDQVIEVPEEEVKSAPIPINPENGEPSMPDVTNEMTTKPSNEGQVAPCPTCQLVETILAVSTATATCELIEDKEKKEQCRKWADALDPEKISDPEDVIWQLLQNEGPDGVNKFTSSFNKLIQSTVLHRVGKMIDEKQEVDPKMMALYRSFDRTRKY